MGKEDDDDIPMDEPSVRSFIVTGGRTQATGVAELPIETLVRAAPGVDPQQAVFERGTLLRTLSDLTSIAEISAHMKLPIRTIQVLVSEMVAENLLVASGPVELVDVSLLMRIRDKIESL